MARLFVVLLVLAATLAGATPGDAREVVRLPLGTSFTGLAVTPAGPVWAAADTGRGGRWGRIGGRWSEYPADRGFLGMLSARPDGGAWLLADAQTAMRIDPDGQASTFGPLAVPVLDSEFTNITHHMATASDGSLVLAGELGSFLRLATDGNAVAQQLAMPIGMLHDCFAADIDAGAGIAIADYRCSRLLRLTPAGAVGEVRLGRRRHPTGVMTRPDGSLWFTARTLRGTRIISIIGRVAPDGSVTQHDAPDVSVQGLAAAPDGTIWAPISGRCAVYRVHRGRVDRLAAPFIVRRLQFAADGSAWLQGHSRLVRLTRAQLEASRRPRRCDTRAPRIRYPDAVDGSAWYPSLSLRVLRRRGLRVRASEPATFSGEMRIDEESVHVHAVIRRPGGTAAARFPPEVLDRLDERVRRERRVDMFSHAPLIDPSGNGIITGYPLRLVP